MIGRGAERRSPWVRREGIGGADQVPHFGRRQQRARGCRIDPGRPNAGGVLPTVLVDRVVACRDHDPAVRFEEANRMLPHGCRDDAKVDQIELDAEIVARGGQAACLGGRERGAGRPGIAREHESSPR